MNNSHLIYFIKHQTSFTMKSYRQTFLSSLPILVLALISLFVLPSCYNPYAGSEEEQLLWQAKEDSLNNLLSCSTEKYEEKISEQEDSLLIVHHQNTLQQKSINELEERANQLFKRTKQLSNANKNWKIKTDTLMENFLRLQAEIRTNKQDLVRYISLDSTNVAILEAKEQTIMGLENEFGEILDIMEKFTAGEPVDDKLKSHLVNEESTQKPSSLTQAFNQKVRQGRIKQLNDFAKELKVHLLVIPQDESGKPIYKRNPTRFKEAWRGLSVSFTIVHPNADKLTDEYLQEFVAIVRNHHNETGSSYHRVSETHDQQEGKHIPYTGRNTINFTYHLDKQENGERFSIGLHYKNPVSKKLILLKEQIIFPEGGTIAPIEAETYLVTEKSE